MAVPEHHIRETVAGYVSGQMPLDDFQVWFVPRAWEILETGTAAAAVASAIELLLAEFSSGDLTEDELREALTPYGSVAKVLDKPSVVVAWEVATSTHAAFVRLSDAPFERAWIHVSQVKEPQAA